MSDSAKMLPRLLSISLVGILISGGAHAQQIYQQCVDKLKIGDDPYCGGLVLGFSLGYQHGKTEQASSTFAGFGAGTGTEGYIFDTGTFGAESPFVIHAPEATTNGAVESFVIEKKIDDKTYNLIEGDNSFYVQQFNTTPLSEWMAGNEGKFDRAKLDALQQAVTEFGGNKPVIYGIPGP